jgi:hypothetical protein
MSNSLPYGKSHVKQHESGRPKSGSDFFSFAVFIRIVLYVPIAYGWTEIGWERWNGVEEGSPEIIQGSFNEKPGGGMPRIRRVTVGATLSVRNF